jgi:hypothetical protein
MDKPTIVIVVYLVIIAIIFLLVPNRNNERVYTPDKSIHENEPKYYLTIGAILRNEAHMIDAWINHHMGEGVEHFYIVDDNSTDNSRDILKSYVDKGIVSLFDIPPNNYLSIFGDIQTYSYTNIILPIAVIETEWIAFIDLDEFLTSRSMHTVVDIMRSISGSFDQIYAGWLMFGSGEHIDNGDIPKDPIESYTTRQKSDSITYMDVKSIYRATKLITPHIHHPKVAGRTLNFMNDITKIDNLDQGEGEGEVLGPDQEQGQIPILVINHYHLQSKGYWYKVKRTRGDAWVWFRYRTEYEFAKKNETYNEVVDTNLRDKTRLRYSRDI